MDAIPLRATAVPLQSPVCGPHRTAERSALFNPVHPYINRPLRPQRLRRLRPPPTSPTSTHHRKHTPTKHHGHLPAATAATKNLTPPLANPHHHPTHDRGAAPADAPQRPRLVDLARHAQHRNHVLYDQAGPLVDPRGTDGGSDQRRGSKNAVNPHFCSDGFFSSFLCGLWFEVWLGWVIEMFVMVELRLELEFMNSPRYCDSTRWGERMGTTRRRKGPPRTSRPALSPRPRPPLSGRLLGGRRRRGRHWNRQWTWAGWEGDKPLRDCPV